MSANSHRKISQTPVVVSHNGGPVNSAQTGSAQWFAVHTKPRQEQLALTNLERQGYTAYLPRIHVNKRVRNRWQTVVEPLFPGYAFIRVDLDRDNIAPVRSTLGVRGMVRFGHVYTPLPGEVIALLQRCEAAQGNNPAEPFKPGDIVTIESGPFAGLEAVYHMAKAGDRAILLLQMLGKQNAIVIGHDDIAPARATI